MTKPRTRIRYRYRDRPVKADNWFSSITVGQIKQWVFVMAPIVVGVWAFAGPYVDAKAADYLKTQLTLIGMDPATVQTLNKNLVALQQKVDEKDQSVDKLSGEVSDLKVDLGKVLILLQTQQQLLNSTPENAK